MKTVRREMCNVNRSVVSVTLELAEEGSAVGVENLDNASFSTRDEEFAILTEGSRVGFVFKPGDCSFDCASGSVVDYDLLLFGGGRKRGVSVVKGEVEIFWR